MIRVEKKGSEIFPEPVLDAGKESATVPGTALGAGGRSPDGFGFFLDPWLQNLLLGPGDGSPGGRGFPHGNIPEIALGFVIHGFKSPGKADLVRLFILSDPVGCVHVPAVFGLFNRVLVILREVNLALKGD